MKRLDLFFSIVLLILGGAYFTVSSVRSTADNRCTTYLTVLWVPIPGTDLQCVRDESAHEWYKHHKQLPIASPSSTEL